MPSIADSIGGFVQTAMHDATALRQQAHAKCLIRWQVAPSRPSKTCTGLLMEKCEYHETTAPDESSGSGKMSRQLSQKASSTGTTFDYVIAHHTARN